MRLRATKLSPYRIAQSGRFIIVVAPLITQDGSFLITQDSNQIVASVTSEAQ